MDWNLIAQRLNPLSVELCLGATLAMLLLADLFLKPSEKRLTAFFAAFGVALSGLALWRVWHQGAYVLGTNTAGMIAADPLALFFKGVFLVAALGAIVMAYRSIDVAPERLGEFHVLLLTVCVGMCFMATARDLVMVYLAVEIVSQTSYILTGYVRNSPRSHEAALKYVVYGAVASGVMIFGISLLYGMAGTTDLHAIGPRLAERLADDSLGSAYAPFLALVMILAGLGFKIAMAPFHMWSPDVYEGAPTPVTAFLSVGPKAAGFALLIRFLYGAVSTSHVQEGERVWAAIPEVSWPFLVALLSALTMTVGNLSAIWQRNIKRLFAYSSIAHAGYLLLGVVAASTYGLSAVLFYFVVYAVMNLGAFLVVVLVANRTGREEIRDYAGLGWTDPFVAIALTIFLFSLVGLPPTAGFLGKWHLLWALVKAGGITHYLLAVIALVNTAISLYYYVYVAKVMWLEEPREPIRVPVGAFRMATLALLAALSTWPFAYWEEVFRFAQVAADRFGQ